MSRKCVACGWEDGVCCATCRAYIEKERTIRAKLWVDRFALFGVTGAMLGIMWLVSCLIAWVCSHLRVIP